MLQGTKIKNYSIAKLLTTSDYLCFDELQNPFLLVLNQSKLIHINEEELLHFPNAIYHSDQIEQQHISYSCYHFNSQLQWIGDISALQFKSQLFCLGILYSLISKVIKPFLDKNINPYNWIHINNMWYNVKNNQIYLLLHNREKSNQGVSLSLFSEKESLRKLAKILVPLFQINLQGNTFLSLLLQSMIKSELTVFEINQMLINKKSRKKYINGIKNIQNKLTIDDNPLRRGLGINQKPLKQRRNLKFEDNSHKNDLKAKLSMKNGNGGLPPSFARKRLSNGTVNMFNLEKSFSVKSKKRKSLNFEKSLDITKRSSITPDKRYFYPMSKLKSITETHREKAMKKFHESLDLSKTDNDMKSRQKQFKRIFDLKKSMTLVSKGRYSVSSYSPQYMQSIQTEPNKIDRLKKQLFQTIQQDEKEIELKRNMILWNKKKEQEKQEEEIRKRQLIRKEEELEKRQKLAKEKEEMLKKEKQQFQRFKKLEKQKEQKIKKEKNLENIEVGLHKSENKKQEKEKKKDEQKKEEQKKDEEKKDEQKSEIELFGNIPQISTNQEYKKSLSTNIQRKKQKSSVLIDDNSVNFPEVQLEQKQKKQNKKQLSKNLNKPPLPAEEKKKKEIKCQYEEDFGDEIQVIDLGNQKKKKNNQKQVKKQKEINKKIQSSIQMKSPMKKNQKPAQSDNSQAEQKEVEFKRKKSDENKSQKRMNTHQSSVASSYGPKKPVSKIISQYLLMINKIGEAVAKSSKLDKKLEGVEWFIGVYFLYKRFLFQRKKIQKWLEKGEPKLTRYGVIQESQWNEWLALDERETLYKKTKTENESIVGSIIKMNKKISKKNLKGNILYHAELKHNSPEQSKIAVSEIVKEYDNLEQKGLLKDGQILTHINELINSLYIIGQLDGKIKERKSLLEIVKTKRTVEELEGMVDEIYQLYIPSTK